MAKSEARLQRQFDRLQRQVPLSAGFLGWVRQPAARLIRIPLGVLLILGGVFSFLPILGIWMLPLGLLLLALDIPLLRGPVVRSTIWIQRKWTTWRRGRKSKP